MNQGDCDFDQQCQLGLKCGSNNCPTNSTYLPTDDCCYNATLGDWNFCSTDNTCGQNEGDCDSHDDCQDGLFCGTNNCPDSYNFEYDVDCCYETTCCHNIEVVFSSDTSPIAEMHS